MSRYTASPPRRWQSPARSSERPAGRVTSRRASAKRIKPGRVPAAIASTSASRHRAASTGPSSDGGGWPAIGSSAAGRARTRSSLPTVLAHVAGEGRDPRGGACLEPVHQLVDHCREATQLFQIPSPVVGCDQGLEVQTPVAACSAVPSGSWPPATPATRRPRRPEYGRLPRRSLPARDRRGSRRLSGPRRGRTGDKPPGRRTILRPRGPSHCSRRLNSPRARLAKWRFCTWNSQYWSASVGAASVIGRMPSPRNETWRFGRGTSVRRARHPENPSRRSTGVKRLSRPVWINGRHEAAVE